MKYFSIFFFFLIFSHIFSKAVSLQRMYRGFHYRKKFQEERLQEYILAKNPLTTLFCFLIFLALLVMCCVVETENVQYVFANQLNDWVTVLFLYIYIFLCCLFSTQ